MENQRILKSIEEGNLLKGQEKDIVDYLKEHLKTIVILDDDPTGTQTVQNIPVITNWEEPILEQELLQSPVFFILTNSRALQKDKAIALITLIGRRLKQLAEKHHKKLLVVNRGDSTLRGHYPDEVMALSKSLGYKNDKHVLIPAFFEGGRYTYGNIHYVREGNTFIPAASTPFAKDNTFSYDASDLTEYAIEKYKGKIDATQITSISLNELRSSPNFANIKKKIEQHQCIIVNATTHADLETFALLALKANIPLVYRTAASFVNAIIGKRPAALLEKDALGKAKGQGGLIVIGSYVPKTTAQLNVLKAKYKASYIELDVDEIFNDENLNASLKKKAERIDLWLGKGENVVLYTSRKVKQGSTKEDSLAIVNRVSQALTTLVELIGPQPRFILAKGGITSSDIAVKSLQIKRAIVIGQLIKGVPVWQADENSKFPGIPYIVFPGNVGTDNDLYNLLNRLE